MKPPEWFVDVQTEELLMELARRFPHGVLMCSRDAEGLPGSCESVRRSWGNKMYCVGAAHILLARTHEYADRDFSDSDD